MPADAMSSSNIGLRQGHAPWVRLVHWLLAGAVLTLAYSGVVILMAHPRLYWGWSGNDLTRPLIELPLGRNYHHGGWEAAIPFSADPSGPVSRVRTYDIFNQNGWARSLHFLMAWGLVAALGLFAAASLATGHLRRDRLPRGEELAGKALWRDLREHLAFRIAPAGGGPPYGVLQKLAYSAVFFILFPLIILTGLTMSPGMDAAWPWLLELFGGRQTARSIHFLTMSAFVLFFVIHIIMVVLANPINELRQMITGRYRAGRDVPYDPSTVDKP